MNNRDRAIIEYWLRYENKCSRDVSFSANCDKFDIQSTSELIIRQMKILPYAIGDVKSIRFLECILADERELATLFGDCALGAEPPFGNLYGMTTIMDESLQDDDYIVFQAGTHEEAVRIAMSDYKAMVQPKILAFSYQTS